MNYLSKRLAQTRDDNGFTLVELLVVILIIGILAAIAIPAFLNQRQVAFDKTVESDVRNAAGQVMSHGLLNKDFNPGPGLTLGFINLPQQLVAAANPDVKLSEDTDMELINYKNESDFCVIATNPNSGSYRAEDGTVSTWDATGGGLNKKGGSCPTDLVIGKDAEGNVIADGTVAVGGTGHFTGEGNKGSRSWEAEFTISFTDSRLSEAELRTVAESALLTGDDVGVAGPNAVNVSGNTATASFNLNGGLGFGGYGPVFDMSYTTPDGSSTTELWFNTQDFNPTTGTPAGLVMWTTDLDFSEAASIRYAPRAGAGA